MPLKGEDINIDESTSIIMLGFSLPDLGTSTSQDKKSSDPHFGAKGMKERRKF